jgi:outer membrane protein TolC
MKINRLFLTLFIIFSAKNSFAFSIENAIDFALKNNQEIKLYEHKLNSSKNYNYQAIAEFLPKIFINVQNGERVNNNFIGINENDRKKSKFSSREISLEHSIFNGFSSLINLKKSEKQYLAELAILKDKKQNLAIETAKIYSNIFWQKKTLENYKKILDITKKILDIEKRKFHAKLIDKEQMIQAQIELENLSQKIAEEQSILIKNYHDFLALTGVKFEGDDNYIEIVENNFKKNEILEKINQNFLLQSKYIKYHLSLDDIDSKTSEFLPKISLIANISKQKNNLYSANREINNRSIMLNFSIPIFQKGFEYIDYKSSKNQSEMILDEYEIYKSYIKNELKKTAEDIDFSLENLKICNEIINFLEEKNHILQTKLNAKIIDVIDFYRGEISLELQRIAQNKLQNILLSSRYKILGLVGEINV